MIKRVFTGDSADTILGRESSVL